MKPCRYSTALLLCVCLTACRPKQITVSKAKEATVSGQMFIVTRGAENIKLGAVEVLLVEKLQVTDFLQRRQSVVESELASRQKQLLAAKEDAERAQASFDSFFASKRPATNSESAKASLQWDSLSRQIDALQRQFYATDALRRQAEAQGDSAKADALLDRQDAILKQQKQKTAELEGLLARLEDIMKAVREEQTNRVQAALSRVAAARSRLEASPTAQDYLAGFAPVVIQKTMTDADGRFTLSYPSGQIFTIFARAQRAVLDGAEEYYWLLNAPTNAETSQVILSNNNLIFADPDGYLTLKPRPTPR